MKKILPILMVIQCILIMATWSYGASDKCIVVGAENHKLILKCNKNTESFQINDKIKIKSMKKSVLKDVN